MIETAAVGWTATRDPTQRAAGVTVASSLLRIGLTPKLEVQVGWTPFGVHYFKDRISGSSSSRSGIGDVTLGFQYGLAGPNGPVAVQAFVSLPTGGSALGAGDWGAGMRLPVAIPVGAKLQLALTPEVDAAVNASGSGRHITYGGAAGIGLPITSRLTMGADIAVFRDKDPAGATTRETSGLSLAWQESGDTQFDLGGTLGLNRASPNLALYFGVAHRFP